MKELIKGLYAILFGLIVITVILLFKISFSKNIIIHISPIETQCPEPTIPLTKENVLKEIIKQEIKEPLIVYRQVLWETGHLKCTNCSMDYNNLFGMGWNGKKYHEYTNWIESVKAYKVWQDKYYKGGNYYDFLDSIGYAEDSKYISNLKRIRV